MNKIVDDFAKLNLNHTKKKVKVGVVGEIYVKYAPLAITAWRSFWNPRTARFACRVF